MVEQYKNLLKSYVGTRQAAPLFKKRFHAKKFLAVTFGLRRGKVVRISYTKQKCFIF